MVKHPVGEYSYDDGEDEIGEGNFGKVFLGRHNQDKNKMAAIKLINFKRSTVRRSAIVFRDREIEILQTLQSTKHPHLVLLLFYQRTDFLIYLVMEFCNGGNLAEYLENNKTLSESTIRGFFKQIGTGVKFLHENKIIHRDLKPENILLNFDGPKYPVPENIILKIADFGLGRFLPSDGCATTDCGTPGYKAPEIESNRYDEKVDLWSIGAMIYECIVGTAKAQRVEKLEIPANASRDLAELVNGLLKKEPHQRFGCDQLMAHSFMDEKMQVSVQGHGSTRIVHITKNSSVDELFEKVVETFGVDDQADAIFLYHQGVPLVHGSGSGVEDAGITNGSIIVLGRRQSGGKERREERTKKSDYAYHLTSGVATV